MDTTRDVWMTTTDNPYDPFTHWDEWYAYDTTHGHNTCELVDRLTSTSPALPEADQLSLIERAITSFVVNDPLKEHIMVIKETKSDRGEGAT